MTTKHTGVRIACLALCAAVAVLLITPREGFAITKEEVITLAKLGIPEAEIIRAIEKDRTVFDLRIQDILELRKAGVPEGVVKFMLGTPERYGRPEDGGVPEAPVVRVQPPTTPDAPPPKSEEELRAEAERMRIEAERRKRDAETAREAQRLAFADAQLTQALQHAEAGRFVPAIQQFQDFLDKGGFTQGTDQHYRARFGIAYALSRANLLQAAARLLVEVLLEGSEKPFFELAFVELRRLRREINYSPPDLEELTRFYVGRFSRDFQDEYNYVLGEFFYDYNNYERALSYLDEVSPASRDYPRAVYLKGLIMVSNNLFRSAVQAFQETIIAADRLGAALDVRDDAYLALARIAYETGNYDGAIYYYRQLRTDSPKLPRAFYESAWTYFQKGDYSRALGTFQVLHSPFFSHFFFPELWILEATVYLNMCYYDNAKEALAMFSREVAALGVPLNDFITQQQNPSDFYRAFVAAVNDRNAELLPARLTFPVLSDVEFFNLYRTIRQIDQEIAIVDRQRDALGVVGVELFEQLNQIRRSRVSEVGIKIQQILRQVDAEIQEYGIKLKEIEVDLLDVESTTLTQEQGEILARRDRETALRRVAMLARRGASEADMKAAIDQQPILRAVTVEELEKFRAEGAVPESIIAYLFTFTREERVEGGRVAIVGSDSLEWPFEGEYWRDEVGGFRSFLRERCE
jgi:tetratricopeptide (TPR) repeat protein